MTSAVYFNCRRPQLLCADTVQCCPFSRQHVEHLLCAGHEQGRLDPLSVYKASHPGTREGAGRSVRGAGYGRRPWLLS